MKRKSTLLMCRTLKTHWILLSAVILSVALSILFSLLPPLLLGQIVDRISGGSALSAWVITIYFLSYLLHGISESAQQSFLLMLGVKITHAFRTAMMRKLSEETADAITSQDPGAIASRFIQDVDRVEVLFTDGIISMFADACRLLSLFVLILFRNRGLSLILLMVMPLIWFFTRHTQKSVLQAEAANRKAVASSSAIIPETIQNIRTIHNIRSEEFMTERYDREIQKSFNAIEKTNFFDAVYSPVINIVSVMVTGLVIVLAASGNDAVLAFFSMSAGTAVTMIGWISQIFSPIESIGMELQTIQSALAGLQRIDEFLAMPERKKTDSSTLSNSDPCIDLTDVSFAYDPSSPVLTHFNMCVHTGEQVYLSGRTGAGKSTIFKLILGLYEPDEGSVRVKGCQASLISDSERRKVFGYVEQNFHLIPGSVRDQITLMDADIDEDAVIRSLRTVGLYDTVSSLTQELDTPCTENIFSQGQWQLLSIARAIAADPSILLLDEITAGLDAATEEKVLNALARASENRTVLSISHRLYRSGNIRRIEI